MEFTLMRRFFARSIVTVIVASAGWGFVPVRGAEAPTIDKALRAAPRHADIEYDVPDPKVWKQCKVEPYKAKVKVKAGKEEKEQEKVIGWEVLGPAGQVLRRFVDTNGDGKVDQYSFFRAGLEVYRDTDSNFNETIDQSRWLNLGGTRWGIDSNEDGRIDQWKVISPEEVSRIAVRALVTQDASLLAPLLVAKDDLQQLGIRGGLEQKLLAAVADPAARLRKAVSGSKIIHAKTSWTKFDSPPPGVVLADTYKTPADLYVYENVMAFVDYGNAQQQGLVKVGELIRVGDAWKMTELPQPLEGSQIELSPGVIMFHALGAGAADSALAQAPTAVPPKVQELIEKRLKPLMEKPPAGGADKATFDKYYRQLETVLIEIVNEMKTDEDRLQWTRQLLDTIAAGVQSGNYPAGVGRLKELESVIAKQSPKSPLVAIARYRRVLADYYATMHEAANDEARQKIQENWLKELEEYLEEFPKADDAPDAALQLAVNYEFAGKLDKAKRWYETVAVDYEEAPAALRAGGAVKRLGLNGQALALSGASAAGGANIDVKQFRGNPILVVFWDTRSKLCAEDMPQIKALHDKYKAKGFEVIGVNLDVEKEAVGPYLAQHQAKWPQIHDGGGLESAAARSFGIISLPTMFLVDSEGKVVNRSASVEDVRKYLQDLYLYDAK
ncbi:MAG: redoxin family protein [Planctomycetaceae bacterium]